MGNPYPCASTRVPAPHLPTSPHLSHLAIMLVSPSCANTNVNIQRVHARVCMRAWRFSRCFHPFALTRLSPPPFTLGQRRDKDALALAALSLALSLVLSDIVSLSVTTRGRQCARPRDDATTTTMLSSSPSSSPSLPLPLPLPPRLLPSDNDAITARSHSSLATLCRRRRRHEDDNVPALMTMRRWR